MRKLLLVFACAAMVMPAAVADDHDRRDTPRETPRETRGKKKAKRQRRAADPPYGTYPNRRGNLPPGLEKQERDRGRLPPGLEKKDRRGQLPPGLEKGR